MLKRTVTLYFPLRFIASCHHFARVFFGLSTSNNMQSDMDANSWTMSMWLSVALAATAYLATCARLRYSLSHRIANRHGYLDRDSFSKMTSNDAHAVLTILAEQEFPSTFSASVFFALFKVSGWRQTSAIL